MKSIRPQLEKARELHKSQRYPGDLAADVLSPATQRVLEYGSHRRISRGLWIGSAIAAMAAAIVLFLVGSHVFNQRVSPNEYAGPVTYDDDSNVSLGSVPVVSTVDSMPPDMQLMPTAAAEMSVSMPSFSLSSDQETQQVPQQPQSNNNSTSTLSEAVL